MVLPADFNKIYGSTATGGLTPISDVNYAKGWEFVGSNPPTKNDFSYLQNLSDRKSQWLYSNKLQRTDPFGDIKSDGEVAISTALENLGLGASAFGIQNRVVISTTGVTQWSVPDVLKKGRKCKVKVIGAGGSGGIGNAITAAGQAAIAGGGGGAGGISESLLDLTGIDSVTVTVGVGGAPVTSLSTNGVSGGTSSFGSYLSATGGLGGGQPSGGESGIGTGGDTNSSGGPGSPGGVLNADNNGVPSMCGGSGGGPGGNGAAQVSATNKAADAKAPGGGGAGLKPSSGSGIKSGRGGNGLVIIEW